ncbi:MAG: hypothetical protein A3F10_07190 [Coxiella sp. RIFCSPHIGHO2_12_FULL_42_15]|nr:MAG: hypothetical protein A3F10_07190 [Coxiella sp. RIFCSPHIGHO2_12_FULL_42_15]
MTTLNHNDEYWMQYALKLATDAERHGEVPVGALVVLDDHCIGQGWNQPIAGHDPTAHAEIVALRAAATAVENYRIVNTTLYVTLEPCVMCVGAMLQARIKRLVFGAYDPRAGAVHSIFEILAESRLNHRIEWHGGVLAEECGALLKSFFQKRR